MTIPGLIANHQKKAAVVQLKRIYQTLSEVLVRTQTDNGPFLSLSFEEADAGKPAITNFQKKYIDPYFTSLNEYKYQNGGLTSLSGEKLTYCLPDDSRTTVTSGGWAYWLCIHGAVPSASVSNSNYFYILVDLNGIKGPNRVGRDIFYFDMMAQKDPNKLVMLRGVGSSMATEDLVKSCHNANTTGGGFNNSWSNGSTCAEWIMRNGWEIPKGYPW